MKYLFKCLLFIDFFLFTSYAIATECAVVTLPISIVDENEKVLEIFSHNGIKTSAIYKHSRFDAIAKGTYKLYLAEGEHSLKLKDWRKRSFLKYKRSMAKIKKGREMISETYEYEKEVIFHDIQVTVHNNRNYQIQSKKNGLVFTELKKRSFDCPKDITEIQLSKSVRTEMKEVLPNHLEYKLRYIILDLFTKNKSSNFHPVADVNYIGVVLDSELVDNGVKVLSVLPYSLAGKLNLASGDEIIALGKKGLNHSKPNQQLDNYINKLKYGENIEVTVIRGGTEKLLTRKYLPLIAPESSYFIGEYFSDAIKAGIQYSHKKGEESDDYLMLEYEQLLLELAEYYENKGEVNNISIIRDKVENPFLGFGIKNTVNRGAIVSHVAKGGVGEKIGLHKDDVIVEFNDDNLQKMSASLIASMFKHIPSGKKSKLKVIRDSKTVFIEFLYQPVKFPEFILNIDLSMTEKSKQKIFTAINTGTFYQDFDHFSYLKKEFSGQLLRKSCTTNCGGSSKSKSNNK